MDAHTPAGSGLDPLLSIEELSDYLHISGQDALRLEAGREGAVRSPPAGVADDIVNLLTAELLGCS